MQAIAQQCAQKKGRRSDGFVVVGTVTVHHRTGFCVANDIFKRLDIHIEQLALSTFYGSQIESTLGCSVGNKML